MESYSYTSYAESGGSSPRSRDVDMKNQQPWEDQSAASNGYKVKFMCSYGGKIHPRPHDNQLSYVGGETKILAVDRFVKFADVTAKLTVLCDGDICFKYQLPGEDLDALISVTDDDDLEHMMHEYERLNRASPTPARLRLFLFPVSGQSLALTPVHSFGATEGRSERERFMDGLNLGHQQSAAPLPQPSGLVSRTHIGDQQDEVVDKRGIEADRIQKHIQDLFRKPSDDNLAAADYHAEKVAEATGCQVSPEQQPVYMIQTPASMYMARPVSTLVNHGQGYYVQRMPTEVYNVMPPSQQQFRPQTYTEGYGMVQSTTATGVTEAQVAYDNTTGSRRQIYYTNHGAVIAQPPLQAAAQHYQAMTAAAAVTLNQENAGKVVPAIITELI